MEAAGESSQSAGESTANACPEEEHRTMNASGDAGSPSNENEDEGVENLTSHFEPPLREGSAAMELDDDDNEEEGGAGSSLSRSRRRPRTMNADGAVAGTTGARGDDGVADAEEEEDDEDAEYEAKRRLFRLVGLYPRQYPPAPRRPLQPADDEDEEETDDEETEGEEDEDEGTPLANGISHSGPPTRSSTSSSRHDGELYVSDSEDEASRLWASRRPALYLRTRSDAERRHDHNTDRNAQEVVTRRMRAEYKPANNRSSLLGSLASPVGPPGPQSGRKAAPAPSPPVGPLPELCLPLLLRRREIGGSLGGRYGSRTWNGTSFVREVRRSSYMLRRLRRRSVLAVHSGCVNALNFSPMDGNLIVSGSDNQQIAISDWMRERVVTKFDPGHEMNIFQTKFLYGSHHLLIASCARDGMVRLSTLNTSGDLVTSKLMFHHGDSCNKVTVHPDEPYSLMSCGEDAAVVHMDVREAESHRLFRVLESPQSSPVPLYSIHGHPLRAHEFCVCGRDPVIRVFDRRKISWSSVGTRFTDALERSSYFSAPVQEYCAFGQAPGCQGREKRLWSQVEAGGSDDGRDEAMETAEDDVELTHRAEAELEAKGEENDDQCPLRRRDGGGDSVLTSEDASREGEEVEQGETETRNGVAQNDAGAAFLVNLHITSAVYSHNGDAILGSYNDADLFLFDTQPGREAYPAHKYCGHRNNSTVKCCNFYGPSSEYILSGSDCGNIFMWSRASEQIANFQTGDALGVVNVLEPHPALPVLATSGLDSDVKVWTPEWSEELEEINPKRWPFEEKMLGRTVLENWMDRESAKTMMIGQSALLRMLRIALQRRRGRDGPMDTGDDDSGSDDEDDDNGDDFDLGGPSGSSGGGGGGGGGPGDSDENGEGSRPFRRRDFCVQS